MKAMKSRAWHWREMVIDGSSTSDCHVELNYDDTELPFSIVNISSHEVASLSNELYYDQLAKSHTINLLVCFITCTDIFHYLY